MENKDLLRQKCLDGASRAREIGGLLAAFGGVLGGLTVFFEEANPNNLARGSLLDELRKFLKSTEPANRGLFELAAALERFALRELPDNPSDRPSLPFSDRQRDRRVEATATKLRRLIKGEPSWTSAPVGEGRLSVSPTYLADILEELTGQRS